MTQVGLVVPPANFSPEPLGTKITEFAKIA